VFDIGFSELLVIGIVALLVLGPERLPKAARLAGLWVRKGRAQWYAVKSEFETELAAEEFKRSLADPLKDVQADLAATGRELNDQLGLAPGQARDAGDADTAVLDWPDTTELLPDSAAPTPAPATPTPGHPRRDEPAPP
jgi:sec-independent protein translocase protein TatB